LHTVTDIWALTPTLHAAQPQCVRPDYNTIIH